MRVSTNGRANPNFDWWTTRGLSTQEIRVQICRHRKQRTTETGRPLAEKERWLASHKMFYGSSSGNIYIMWSSRTVDTKSPSAVINVLIWPVSLLFFFLFFFSCIFLLLCPLFSWETNTYLQISSSHELCLHAYPVLCTRWWWKSLRWQQTRWPSARWSQMGCQMRLLLWQGQTCCLLWSQLWL